MATPKRAAKIMRGSGNLRMGRKEYNP
jgi:hypothetical protein